MGDAGGSAGGGILARGYTRAVLSVGSEVAPLLGDGAQCGGSGLSVLGRQVVELARAGYQVVVVHDAGACGVTAPQESLRPERAGAETYAAWLAGRQGKRGYCVQQAIHNEMVRAQLGRPVVTMITQVGLRMVGHGGRAGCGGRQEALWVVNAGSMRLLADGGVVVVAAGGGGIPVTLLDDGTLQGTTEAPEHDLVAEYLASSVGADLLVILTDTPGLRSGVGEWNERFIRRMSVQEAVCYLEEGAFPCRRSRQRVLSSIRFIEGGGRAVLIAQWGRLGEALAGREGTWIVSEGHGGRGQLRISMEV